MSVYHQEGKDLQESFDCAGELLKSRYREWYLTLTQLPTWGEDIDKQVQLYISSVQNVALANLNWRFVTVIFFPILRADKISIPTVTVQKGIGMGTITKSGSLGLSPFQLLLRRHQSGRRVGEAIRWHTLFHHGTKLKAVFQRYFFPPFLSV